MENDNLRLLAERNNVIDENTMFKELERTLKRNRYKQMLEVAVFLYAAGSILAVSLYLSISLEPLLLKVLGGAE